MRENNHENAAKVIMGELGRLMVQDRENFVTILKFSGVPATEDMTDAQLISLFSRYAPQNRNLLVSAAYYVSRANQKVGFDGLPEISDKATKRIHQVLYNHFDASLPAEVQAYSNLSGIAAAVDSLGKLGGKIVDQQRAKKYGATDALQKKRDAEAAMAMAAMKERQQQQAAAIKRQQEKDKRKRIILYTAAGLGGALIITGVIVYVVSRKKKA